MLFWPQLCVQTCATPIPSPGSLSRLRATPFPIFSSTSSFTSVYPRSDVCLRPGVDQESTGDRWETGSMCSGEHNPPSSVNSS